MHVIEFIISNENLNKIFFQLRRISGTGKAQARVDKYENKRYVDTETLSCLVFVMTRGNS